MGREIRRVPLDWEHPKEGNGIYKPTNDISFKEASEQWKKDLALWDNKQGSYSDAFEDEEYWEYDSPPDRETHRERIWTPEEAVGYQIYENVSEGTPTSPVFKDENEMLQWLLSEGYSEANATAFIKGGSVPSMIFSGGQLLTDINTASQLYNNKQ